MTSLPGVHRRSRPALAWAPFLIGLLLLGPLLAGCREAPAPRAIERVVGGGPALRLAWRIPLQEGDSAYITSPGEFAVDPDDGSFYVADRFAGRVAHVDRRGRITRFYGRKGAGPGEFTQVSLMFTIGDDLVVDDVAKGLFNIFDRRTGEFREQRAHEGIFYDVRLTEEAAWMGMQNVQRGTAVGRWNRRTASLEYLVPLPREYRESQPLAGIYNGAFVVPWADTLLVALQASDDLYLHSADGRAIDTIPVPVVARRGVPGDIIEKFKKLPYPEMFSAASGVFAVGRMADGRVAVVHFDQRMEGPAILAEVYVSVISADRRTACVDGAVPVSPDAQPRVLFRGDTLLVLDQRLAADDRAETTVSAYLLDTSGCRWMRTG